MRGPARVFEACLLAMLFVTLPVWGLILVVAVSFHAACAAVTRWRHPWTDFGGGSSGEG